MILICPARRLFMTRRSFCWNDFLRSFVRPEGPFIGMTARPLIRPEGPFIGESNSFLLMISSSFFSFFFQLAQCIFKSFHRFSKFKLFLFFVAIYFSVVRRL